MLIRALLVFALVLPVAASAQLYMGNEQSQALRKEGENFEQQDKNKEAMARYLAAFEADRKSPVPANCQAGCAWASCTMHGDRKWPGCGSFRAPG